jgi:spore maturation protein CgeB
MRILYIAKFHKMWDEEYIARSFEMLGHTVGRIDESSKYRQIIADIEQFKPDFVIFAKLNQHYTEKLIEDCRKMKIKTVSWVFDLYFGYNRQYQLNNPNFKADYVFTTDGGDHDWSIYGINHQVVRQGIYKPECVLEKGEKIYDVLFVGSFNPYNKERNRILDLVNADFSLKWIGKNNDNEVRGMKLNRLYAQAKIVVGDSVPSPHYWSNRVVETLGRGGFLIHVEVEGLKEAYPHLVTYKQGDYDDLKQKIEYYLAHNKERNAIIKKNHKWVLDNYTCDKQCEKLCQSL